MTLKCPFTQWALLAKFQEYLHFFLLHLAPFSLSNSKLYLWNYYQLKLIALLNKYSEMPFKTVQGISNISCTENYA